MIGVGYRHEMREWPVTQVDADFFEVIAENWLRRDRAPLHALIKSGRPIYLHGVSLNLGGHSPIDPQFLKGVRELMDEMKSPFYSDHLASSGDAHQLYDLFPIPCTVSEARRVSDRIKKAQDILGKPISIENATWYTNVGDLPETAFISYVLEHADCSLLLDLNNITVNYKNHGVASLDDFINHIDLNRVSYLHVAGHEFDARFNMYIDTHSQPVEPQTATLAKKLAASLDVDILLEWDNDIPRIETINQELSCLRPSMTM